MHAKEHQILVNAIVVYFVPMNVRDVEKGFKPLLLSVKCRQLREELGDPS